MKLKYVITVTILFIIIAVFMFREQPVAQPKQLKPDLIPQQETETYQVPSTPEVENKNPSHPQIILKNPQESQTISSPINIEGEARGTWFFEATFPIVLTNWDGLIIAEGFATAQGEWMTEEFVPFTAELTFTSDTTVSNRGSLILQKSNPSGLPENDDAYEITVFFEQ